MGGWGGNSRWAAASRPLALSMSVFVLTLVHVLVVEVGGGGGGPADTTDEFKIGSRTGGKLVPAPEEAPSLRTCRIMRTI